MLRLRHVAFYEVLKTSLMLLHKLYSQETFSKHFPTKTNPNNYRFFTQPLFLGVGYAAVPPLASYVASFAGWQGVHVFFAILCGLGAFFGALFKPIKVLIYEEDTSNVIRCHERSPPAESSWTDNQQVWARLLKKYIPYYNANLGPTAVAGEADIVNSASACHTGGPI